MRINADTQGGCFRALFRSPGRVGARAAPHTGSAARATRARRLGSVRARWIAAPSLVLRMTCAETRSGLCSRRPGAIYLDLDTCPSASGRTVSTKAPLALMFCVSPSTGSPDSAMSPTGTLRTRRRPQRCSMNSHRTASYEASRRRIVPALSRNQYAIATTEPHRNRPTACIELLSRRLERFSGAGGTARMRASRRSAFRCRAARDGG